MNRGQKGVEMVIRGGKDRERGSEREREREREKSGCSDPQEPLRPVTVESTI